MGSATSSNSVNKLSHKTILKGQSKKDIIKALKSLREEIEPFHLMRYGRHFIMDRKDANKMRNKIALTNGSIGCVSAVSAAETGALVGTITGVGGGPIGMVVGHIFGAALGGTIGVMAARRVHYEQLRGLKMQGWHHFIVIEYGHLLEEAIDGFTYQQFVRLDFSNEGYSITKGECCEFWNMFKDEKETKDGYLYNSTPCNWSLDVLIAAIKQTKSQYHVLRNNCQDFSKLIWKKMIVDHDILISRHLHDP